MFDRDDHGGLRQFRKPTRWAWAFGYLGFAMGVSGTGSLFEYISTYVMGETQELPFEVGVIILSVLGAIAGFVFVVGCLCWTGTRGRWRLSQPSWISLAFASGTLYMAIARGVSAIGLSQYVPDPVIWVYVIGTPVALAYGVVMLAQEGRDYLPACPGCGHLLYYAGEKRCPECGRPFTISEIDMTHAVVGEDGVLRPRQEATDPDSNAT